MIRVFQVVRGIALILLCLPMMLWAEEEPQKLNLDDLTAPEFMTFVRSYSLDNVWMDLSGKLLCKRKGADLLESDLLLRASFGLDSVMGQITMGNGNVYIFTQHKGAEGSPEMELDLPEDDKSPSLFDFGIAPSDLSFAFIYWNLVEELPRQSSRMQACRVMKLANPDGSGYAEVLFHAKMGFPMEAKWFRNGESTPWRTMVMKGAKRHESGFWFVKEMVLEGDEWKTSVRFDYVNKNQISE